MYIYNYLDDKVSAKWRKTNPAISNLKISKEEKKMHKKMKLDGHVAHVLYDKHGHSSEYLYTVNPEKHEVVAWLPIYTFGEPDALPEYKRYEWVLIIPNMLGRHGYLQEAIHKLQTAVFGSDYRARDILAKIATSVYGAKKNLKEEKKMGEIKKDRITLAASEGCYLETFSGSNTILFHFGTESREVTIPDDYEIDWDIKEMGTCDLRIIKKKPKLLNMKFIVKARPIFRQKYANVTNDICDSAISFPEPYEGETLRLIIRDGIISTLSSDEELRECVGYTEYTVNDIPLIERKLREAYNTRKIFPNATNGIEIIKEEI